MAPPAPQRDGARPGQSWFWALGLGCGVLVATAAPLALVLAVLFAPALLATLAANGSTRRPGAILLVYGFAGVLPWLETLWSGAQNWAVSLDLLASMRVVGVCWGAQAAAWLFGELVPVMARQVLEFRVRARAARLRAVRSRLEEEWGLGEGQAPDVDRLNGA